MIPITIQYKRTSGMRKKYAPSTSSSIPVICSSAFIASSLLSQFAAVSCTRRIGTTLVVDHRFAWGLAEGMLDAGLELK